VLGTERNEQSGQEARSSCLNDTISSRRFAEWLGVLISTTQGTYRLRGNVNSIKCPVLAPSKAQISLEGQNQKVDQADSHRKNCVQPHGPEWPAPASCELPYAIICKCIPLQRGGRPRDAFFGWVQASGEVVAKWHAETCHKRTGKVPATQVAPS
jgi:hypothetical protein